MIGNHDLPAGWMMTTLGEVVGYGKTEKAEPHEIPDDAWVLELEDIEKDSSQILQRVKFSERKSKSTKNRFERGDVLYGKLRPYLNKVVIADAPGYCTTEIVPIKSNDVVEGRYLFYWLKHPAFLEYVTGVSHGLNMPRLGTESGKKAPFILAPLDEQKRIADKLDRLLAVVDTCKARLDAIPTILKHFRQSVLAVAVSGRLTEDWRLTRTSDSTGADRVFEDELLKIRYVQDNPELARKKSSLNTRADHEYLFEMPESWAFTTWGAVSEWITYGFTRPMPAAKKGIKLLTAKDIYPRDLRLDTAGWTSQQAFDALSDKDRPRVGDLLITKDGTIGRAALVDTAEPLCINQSVAVCWLRSTRMNKEYLELVANAGFTQRFVRDKASGMAIQHLSITDFAKCPVPVPPDAEQIEIVRRVERLFLFADQLTSRLNVASERVMALTSGLLVKAFRGELLESEPQLAAVGPNSPALISKQTRHFARAVLSAEIVNRLHAEPTFGRVKHQKIFHLCEHIAQLQEIEGQYHREAAGPLDNRLIYANVSELKKQQWYEEYSRQKTGHAYRPLIKAGQHRKYAERYWPDKLAEVEKLIELMRTWSTEQCEIFSTCYAAWNDLIITGGPVGDDLIIGEILKNWHPSKVRISTQRWQAALHWMRDKGLIPTGFGRSTKKEPTI